MVTMDSRERDRDGEGCGGGDDDDILEEIIIMSPTESTSGGASLSSFSSYFSSPSDFNSPFGSEIGSTETESEDDDYIAELNQLTRWMAEYTFQEDDDDDEFLKSSPQAAAPNNSQASGLSLKLLNSNFNSVNIWKEEFMNTTSTEKANSDSWLSAMNNSNSEICSDKILSDEQTKRLEEVYQFNNQPETHKKQGFIDHGVKRMTEPRNMENHKGEKSWRKRILNPPHPHPHLHLHPHRHPSAPAAQNGSGMKAVFLGGSSNGKGSSGTGVFLPTGAYRRTAEPKKKQGRGGGSTVLIPARVLHTLQQHFNNVGAVSQSKGGDDDASSTNTSPWQNDVLARINELLSQQKEKAEFRPRQQQQQALAKAKYIDEEILKLPKEWTY